MEMNPFICIAEFTPDKATKIELLTELRPQSRAGSFDPTTPWKYLHLCSHPAAESGVDDALRWRGSFIRTSEEEAAHANFDDEQNVRRVTVGEQSVASLWPTMAGVLHNDNECLFKCYVNRESATVAKCRESSTSYLQMPGFASRRPGGAAAQANLAQQQQQRGGLHHPAGGGGAASSSAVAGGGASPHSGVGGAGGDAPLTRSLFERLRDVASKIFEEVPQPTAESTSAALVNQPSGATSHSLQPSARPSSTTVSPMLLPPAAGGAAGSGRGAAFPATSPLTPVSVASVSSSSAGSGASSGRPQNQRSSSPGLAAAAPGLAPPIQIVSFTAPELGDATVLAAVFQIRDPDVRAETRSLAVALCHPDFNTVARNSARLIDGLVGFAHSLMVDSLGFCRAVEQGQRFEPEPLFLRFAYYWPETQQSIHLRNNNDSDNSAFLSDNRPISSRASNLSDRTARSRLIESSPGLQRRARKRIMSSSLRLWHNQLTRILMFIAGPPVNPNSSSVGSGGLFNLSLSLLPDQQRHLQQQQQQAAALVHSLLRERDDDLHRLLLLLRPCCSASASATAPAASSQDSLDDGGNKNLLVEVLSAVFKGELVLIAPQTQRDAQLATDLVGALASLLPPQQRKVAVELPTARLRQDEPKFNLISTLWSRDLDEVLDRQLCVAAVEEASPLAATAAAPSAEAAVANQNQEQEQQPQRGINESSDDDSTRNINNANINNNNINNETSNDEGSAAGGAVAVQQQQEQAHAHRYRPRGGAVVLRITRNGVTKIYTSDEVWYDFSSSRRNNNNNNVNDNNDSSRNNNSADAAAVITTNIPLPRSAPNVAFAVAHKIVTTSSQQQNQQRDENNNNNTTTNNTTTNNNNNNNSSVPLRCVLAPMLEMAQKIANGYVALLSNYISSAERLTSASGKSNRGGGAGGHRGVVSSTTMRSNGSFGGGRGGAGGAQPHFVHSAPNNNNQSFTSLAGGGAAAGPGGGGASNRYFPFRRDSDTLSDGGYSAAVGNDSFDDRQKALLQPLSGRNAVNADEDEDEEQVDSPHVRGSFLDRAVSTLREFFSSDPVLPDSSTGGLPSRRPARGRRGQGSNQPALPSGRDSNASFGAFSSVVSMRTAPPRHQQAAAVAAGLLPDNSDDENSGSLVNASAAHSSASFHRLASSDNNTANAAATAQQQPTGTPPTQRSGGAANTTPSSGGGGQRPSAAAAAGGAGPLPPPLAVTDLMAASASLARDAQILSAMLNSTISIDEFSRAAAAGRAPRPRLTSSESLALLQRLNSHIGSFYFWHMFRSPTPADFVAMMNLARRRKSPGGAGATCDGGRVSSSNLFE